VLALAVVAAALVAAGPAAARTPDTTPVDANGKKSCALFSAGGSVVWISHGTVVTTDTGEKLKCSDGQWVHESGTRPAPGTWLVRSPQYGVVTLEVQATKG
jgi:hypothetical protein